MDKSTLISDLDALDAKLEKVEESVKAEPALPKTTVITRVFSEEHLVLLLLLLFVMYPSIGKFIEKASGPLGSFSFVSKALVCVSVYVIYKELFL